MSGSNLNIRVTTLGQVPYSQYTQRNIPKPCLLMCGLAAGSDQDDHGRESR
jgi:hypothetical protein